MFSKRIAIDPCQMYDDDTKTAVLANARRAIGVVVYDIDIINIARNEAGFTASRELSKIKYVLETIQYIFSNYNNVNKKSFIKFMADTTFPVFYSALEYYNKQLGFIQHRVVNLTSVPQKSLAENNATSYPTSYPTSNDIIALLVCVIGLPESEWGGS